MGILIGIGLGAIILPVLVGVMVKLIIDANSIAFTGRAFKYLSWPVVILLICVGIYFSWNLLNTIGLPRNADATEFQKSIMSLFSLSTLIGIPVLLTLAIYGIARKYIWDSKKETVDIAANKLEQAVGHDPSLRKLWVRWWFYLSGAVILFLTFLVAIDFMGNFPRLFMFLLYSFLAYPFVLLGAYLHGVWRKYRNRNSGL